MNLKERFIQVQHFVFFIADGRVAPFGNLWIFEKKTGEIVRDAAVALKATQRVFGSACRSVCVVQIWASTGGGHRPESVGGVGNGHCMHWTEVEACCRAPYAPYPSPGRVVLAREVNSAGGFYWTRDFCRCTKGCSSVPCWWNFAACCVR